MNCAVHADREAVGFCRNCGKAMCSDCTHPVKDVLYCEDCLAKILGHSVPPVGALTQTAAPAPHVGASPGLAFVLGLSVPGLGAVYNQSARPHCRFRRHHRRPKQWRERGLHCHARSSAHRVHFLYGIRRHAHCPGSQRGSDSLGPPRFLEYKPPHRAHSSDRPGHFVSPGQFRLLQPGSHFPVLAGHSNCRRVIDVGKTAQPHVLKGVLRWLIKPAVPARVAPAAVSWGPRSSFRSACFFCWTCGAGTPTSRSATPGL